MTDQDNLVAALAAFHKDCQSIEEKSRAQFGAFADLSTVLSAVTPALSKHGLALVQTFDTEGDDDILVTTLYHTSGRHIFSRARLPRVEGAGGRQNPLHLWGGSVTYARRYTALALLGLAAGMEDDDGDSAGPVKPARKTVKKAAPKAEPVKLDPFMGPVDASMALDECNSDGELKLWVARLKASSLADEEVAELRRNYASKIAATKTAGAEA
tara:strand:- start:6954 stop:7592 length:639 start_codon:yes stop_codon:yes gene_type:complete